jgi:tetratricopeptide (TPR) repeat protein
MNSSENLTAPRVESAQDSQLGWIRWLERPAILAVLLAAMTLLAYIPSLGNGFVTFDDPDYVYKNTTVLKGLTWEGIRWAFTTDHMANWHPVTWLSHMLDVQLYGLKPMGHHLTSLLLHLANTLLLFGLLDRLTGARWRSFLVAALFAVHPLHVESVAWLAERKDVLSALFFFLTLAAYHRFVSQSDPKTRRRAYVLALVWFALGLMSKPMLVTLPFVLLLIDYWPLNRWSLEPKPDKAGPLRESLSIFWRQFQPLCREKIPFFAVTVLSCVVTFLAQHSGGAVQTLGTMPLSARLENAIVSYARYLGKTFWPVNLTAPYPHPGHWPWPLVVFSIVLLLGILGSVWWIGRRHRYVATGWLWFIGILVPVIGLLQVGEQSMADRYMYLPIVGVFLVVVWGVADGLAGRAGSTAAVIPQSGPFLPLAIAGALVLAACGIRTWDQCQVWKSGESLFRHALAVTEKNWLASYNLGWILDDQGKLDEAVPYYRRAVELQPAFHEAWNNLGCAYATRKQYAEALPCFEAALRLKPGDVEFQKNVAGALTELGRNDELISRLQSILEKQPRNPEARTGLGLALARRNRFAEAIPHLEQSLKENPQQPIVHYNLATALARAGRADEAMRHYEIAVHKNPDYAEAQGDLGLALARKGKLPEAASHLRIAVRLKPENLNLQCTLAKALAAQQQIEEAIALYRGVLQSAPTNAEAHAGLGLVLANQGNEKAAVPHLQQAVQYRPTDVSAHFNLAKALASQGQIGEAKKHYNEALRLRPDFTPARKELEALQAKGQ